MNDVVRGAAAGVLATIPMTVTMVEQFRELPLWQRSPLPPRKITMTLAERLHLRRKMSESQRTGATLLSHFGYGGVVGALYPKLMKDVALPPFVKGTCYGLGVWAGSYLGLLPAIGLHKPATKEPAQRNFMMLAAHVVWGAALGLGYELLNRRGNGPAAAQWEGQEDGERNEAQIMH